MYTFDELNALVKAWAESKGLLVEENAHKQMLKVMEEVGETAGAIAKQNREAVIDGIGDSFVTLIILSYQLGLEPSDCLAAAWNEIKDRTGRTENGVFIKNQ
jgi:NTP pyrophosphatase (non-canonical NTP hydrolase)